MIHMRDDDQEVKDVSVTSDMKSGTSVPRNASNVIS